MPRRYWARQLRTISEWVQINIRCPGRSQLHRRNTSVGRGYVQTMPAFLRLRQAFQVHTPTKCSCFDKQLPLKRGKDANHNATRKYVVLCSTSRHYDQLSLVRMACLYHEPLGACSNQRCVSALLIDRETFSYKQDLLSDAFRGSKLLGME